MDQIVKESSSFFVGIIVGSTINSINRQVLSKVTTSSAAKLLSFVVLNSAASIYVVNLMGIQNSASQLFNIGLYGSQISDFGEYLNLMSSIINLDLPEHINLVSHQ